jgi:hypothetical protein
MAAMAARDWLAQYEAMNQPRDKPRRASVRGLDAQGTRQAPHSHLIAPSEALWHE